MKVLIVEPMRSPIAADIKEDLASMQAVVGRPIQAVYPFDEPVALVCHEEGKGAEKFGFLVGRRLIQSN